MKRWPTRKAFGLTLACALLSGCGSGVEPDQSSSAPDPAGETSLEQGLNLTSASPEAVSGSYVAGVVGLVFSTERSEKATHVALRALDGRMLLEVDDDATSGMQRLRMLDGRLTQTISHRLLDVSSASTTTPGPNDFKSEGDVDAANELMEMPEYSLLKDLSRALGELGYDGRSYPSTLGLHMLALQHVQSASMREMANQLGGSVGGSRLQGLAPGSPCVPITCPNGTKACFGGNGCNSGPINWCPTWGGGDLRSDPCGNKCYGMCGSECSCWTWVCGDCSYHSGCAAHDDWCRSCSVWAPWNCALCYSPTALVGLDCRL